MTPARTITLRPGFTADTRALGAAIVRHEMAVCAVIAWAIGFAGAVIACL